MPEKGLNVAIIGAGIAGSISARVLRESHRVTIYERSQNISEVGAAISIGPTVVKFLEEVGFDRKRAGCVSAGALKVYNSHDKLLYEGYPNILEEFGADWLFVHRVDLREEFLRLATIESKELGITGEPARISWDSEVVKVDAEKGQITLSTGKQIQADLVIAADGIKSVARYAVVGDAAFSTARPSGLSAFRFTLSKEVIQTALGEIPELLQPDKPPCLAQVFATDVTSRRIVIYPCRNFEVLNFVCIVPDERLKTKTTESWSAPGSREELLENFQDFPKWTLQFLRIAENIKLWQLRDQDPLPTYTLGRTVLIGDAAHAMTPHQGQGGTQSVEDGEGFRLFLQPNVTTDQVPSILKDYESVRRKRASQIQIHTMNAQHSRTAEDTERYRKYNWTYPGIVEGLRRVKAGEELISL